MSREDLLTFKGNIEEALSVSEENAMNSPKDQLAKAEAAAEPDDKAAKKERVRIVKEIKTKYHGRTVMANQENVASEDVVIDSNRKGPMQAWIYDAYVNGKLDSHLQDQDEAPGVITPEDESAE